jgi:hypothetical protein
VTHAPDLVEPVIAFRSWRVVDGELVSPFVDERWGAEIVVARCHRGSAETFRYADELLPYEHVSPHPDCRCGIHAYFEPRSAVSGVDYRGVLGLAAMWGRIEVHPAGLRAQYARVQALGSSPSWSGRQRAAVIAIADRLQLPLIDEQALPVAATDFGSPLPASLRRPRD